MLSSFPSDPDLSWTLFAKGKRIFLCLESDKASLIQHLPKFSAGNFAHKAALQPKEAQTLLSLHNAGLARISVREDFLLISSWSTGREEQFSIFFRPAPPPNCFLTEEPLVGKIGEGRLDCCLGPFLRLSSPLLSCILWQGFELGALGEGLAVTTLAAFFSPSEFCWKIPPSIRLLRHLPQDDRIFLYAVSEPDKSGERKCVICGPDWTFSFCLERADPLLLKAVKDQVKANWDEDYFLWWGFRAGLIESLAKMVQDKGVGPEESDWFLFGRQDPSQEGGEGFLPMQSLAKRPPILLHPHKFLTLLNALSETHFSFLLKGSHLHLEGAHERAALALPAPPLLTPRRQIQREIHLGE